MRRLHVIGMLLALTMTLANGEELVRPAIIPAPQKLELGKGVFVVRSSVKIMADADSQKTGEYLAERLRKSTGYAIPVSGAGKAQESGGNILLTSMGAGADLGAEGYELTVTTNLTVIRAPTQAGLFYGVQSLLQLMQPEVFAVRPMSGKTWEVPVVQIEDQPRFKWRGMMLDVSRHFFDKQEVERLLDLMALLKLNTFHWHLVDNDGWRIEIKKYPRLTQASAWRKDIGYGLAPRDSTAYGSDGRYGGFYTQDDIREVVKYAAARHIDIVPEIEMPGHSAAALAAYPELGCTNGSNIGVYCAGNKRTFAFLEDVLTEVFELFPSKYIHIGGDEVSKGNWSRCPVCQARMKEEGLKNEQELQSYFIRCIEKFIAGHGRTLVGWSEVRQGGLAEDAVMMDWIGGGKESASEGHDVVMSPESYCYFDHYQSLDYSAEPVAIGCYLPLWQVYAFEPVPADLPPQYQSHILGAQGNIWTEYIASTSYLEYMAFPRLCALAEVVWSPKEARDWNDFNRRLQVHNRRLDVLGVNYRTDDSVKIGEWALTPVAGHDATLEWDVTHIVTQPNNTRLILDDVYRPSTDGLVAEPGKCHVVFDYVRGAGLKIDWVALLENGNEISRDTHVGYTGPKPRDLAARDAAYILTLTAAKAGNQYTIQAHVRASGNDDSRGNVELRTMVKYGL